MNAEIHNDRAKLLMHRIVARRLKTEPELVDQARQVLERWARERPYLASDSWMTAWAEILQLPPETVRSEIVRRTERATWLRNTSPFGVVPGLFPQDYAWRSRIWRIAKRGCERSRSRL